MMRGFRAVLRKEAKQMLRDRGTLQFAMMLPALQLVLFGLIDTNVSHVPTAVFDQSRTEESRTLVRDFVNTGLFDVVEYAPSHDLLRERIVAGRASVGLEIPPDFARRRLTGRPADVLVLIDGSDSSISSQALAAANGAALARSLAELGVGEGFERLSIRVHPLLLFNPEAQEVAFALPEGDWLLALDSSGVLARRQGSLPRALGLPAHSLVVLRPPDPHPSSAPTYC